MSDEKSVGLILELSSDSDSQFWSTVKCLLRCIIESSIAQIPHSPEELSWSLLSESGSRSSVQKCVRKSTWWVDHRVCQLARVLITDAAEKQQRREGRRTRTTKNDAIEENEHRVIACGQQIRRRRPIASAWHRASSWASHQQRAASSKTSTDLQPQQQRQRRRQWQWFLHSWLRLCKWF